MAQESYAREAREPHSPVGRLSPVSLSVFSLVPDLLFDCSRVLEYGKIRTVLQSKVYIAKTTTLHVHHVLSRTGTQDRNFLFLFLNFDTVL